MPYYTVTIEQHPENGVAMKTISVDTEDSHFSVYTVRERFIDMLNDDKFLCIIKQDDCLFSMSTSSIKTINIEKKLTELDIIMEEAKKKEREELEIK